MRTLSIILAILLTSLCCSLSLAAAGNGNRAVPAARAWLSLIDAGNYGESWQEASDYFRGAVTEQNWSSSLKGVRAPLGRLVKRTLEGSREAGSLPGAPDGSYVVITFRTTFQHKRTAMETVTFMLDGTRGWRAAGYFIK